MYTNILFATDLLNEHQNMAKKAAKIAQQFNAKLYFLHVIELPASIQIAQGLGFTELAQPAKDDAETVLSLLCDTMNIPANQQFVEIGSVKEHINNKAKELDCQLIILGRHSSTGFQAILGSTAHAVVNHPPSDVLTLKI